MRPLDRRKQKTAVLDTNVLTREIHCLACEELLVDREELVSEGIALIVRVKDAISRWMRG